ncbi:ATP-binding protein [Geminicoccaceae bacterium 1502E]|nr:ATP-binding protein [Geminicoccaceae bacterium 1502E]
MGPFRTFLNRTVVPRSLFTRSLLIVVLPVVVLQVVLTVIFYNRHWDTVTRWLATGVAGEVALTAELLGERHDLAGRDQVMEQVRKFTDLRMSFEPGGTLEAAARDADLADPVRGHIDEKILEAFQESLRQPFLLDLRSDVPQRIAVYVQLPDGLLRVLAPRKRVTSTTTGLLLAWMLGVSTVLLLVAIYFLRLQIRPIRKLARAMESFGKGRDIGDYRPQGAQEIRQAAHAFNLMRQRILRHLGQRTEMLAAVSHDLRTPLTRMKLELELLDSTEKPVFAELREDVEEMAQIIESYLSFARGEGREGIEPVALRPLLENMRERGERAGAAVELRDGEEILLPARPVALRRCLANLVDNAARHGRSIALGARRRGRHVEITVEDDGPGIPKSQREAVFRPFVRLDQSRSRATGGVGLGLTIARDVALGHGGDLRLDQSAQGGLKAIIRLPL